VRGALVGRLDAKAHRSEGVFEVRAVHLEAGVVADESLANDMADAVVRCARWHKTPTVRIIKTAPSSFFPKLRNAVKRAALPEL
jgi:uncharacterized protein